jgi:hypothetical protein
MYQLACTGTEIDKLKVNTHCAENGLACMRLTAPQYMAAPKQNDSEHTCLKNRARAHELQPTFVSAFGVRCQTDCYERTQRCGAEGKGTPTIAIECGVRGVAAVGRAVQRIDGSRINLTPN